MKARSLFAPFALVAVGAIWILINMNIVAESSLWALLYYLPILLIALGAGMILRSRWNAGGMAISALVVVGAVAVILAAPQLGWNKVPAWAARMNISGDFGGNTPGSGKIASETRPVSDFNAVAIRYPADVVIRQGESESLTIEADDNLLPQLRTQVSSGRLIIDNSEQNWNKRVNATQPVRITLIVKDLGDLDLSGAGNVRIEGLHTADLKVWISGAGELSLTDIAVTTLFCNSSGAASITATGTADTLTLEISGAGKFLAPDLSTQNADVQISGVGDASVWAKSKLTVDISGAGSVRYYGSPQVTQRISGAGSVNKSGDK
jgi:hypothetical protein